MTSPERVAELKKRREDRLERIGRIEIFKDDKLVFIYDQINEAISFIREWLMKTPFWEIVSMKLYQYKKPKTNEDYINRKKIREEEEKSYEKNLMFKDDKRKYTCLRCRKESEICGFCQKCYNYVYGLKGSETVEVKLEDVKCSDKFMVCVENDPEYTEAIKQSIVLDGMKNPIVLDEQNRILIGHHRYYIAKDLGWDTIQAIYNPIKFGHGYFYEGKGHNLFICKVNNNLEGSSTNAEDIITLIRDFDAHNSEGTLEAEFFLNIGSDIRLRNVFIPERGHIVDQTWLEWWINKFGKDPR